MQQAFVIGIVFCVVALTQSACIFERKNITLDIVRTDTIGVASGEIGYIANNELFIQNVAGAAPRQISFDGIAKERLVMRGDRKQVTTTTSTYPKIFNLVPIQNGIQNLSSDDYAKPTSFGYWGLDTFYVLTPRTQNAPAKFTSTSPSFTTFIKNRLSPLFTSVDILQFLSISKKYDIATVDSNAVTHSFRLAWKDPNNITKYYTISQKMTQPKWSVDGETLFITTTRGILEWKRADSSPKMIIFGVNISSFAINPEANEIAYTTGNDSIHIRNPNFPKANRDFGTLPKGAAIKDMDWK